MNIPKGASSQMNVSKLYQSVIDEVITNIRESFLDDGVDEQVLVELKHTWEAKVAQSRAIESQPKLTTIQSQHPQQSMYTVYPTGTNKPGEGQRIIYQSVPRVGGGQTLHLTPAAQQATLALPNNIIYQQQPSLPTGNINHAHVYAPYQSAATQQSSAAGGRVIIAGNSSIATTSSSERVVQVDGAAEQVETPPRLQKVKFCKVKPSRKVVLQLDGNIDSSSDDDDDDDDDDDSDEDDDDDNATKQHSAHDDDEPELGTDDDCSDEDDNDLFDTDNVVVCQYDKIHRTKSRWKFNLKVGIMNLDGKDHVFQKATGEADW